MAFDNFVQSLEARRLMAFSPYAQLIDQDSAASDFPAITGKGVTVAVIDTGIDYTNPSLGGGFGKGFKVIGGYDFASNDDDPMDESGHGTNVAGTIAANRYTVNGVTYQGIAPDAKLVALRVGGESDISDSNIERALRWVINNYKQYNISVVNLSLGSGSYTNANTDSQLADEFKKLHDLGIFVVAASGNSNEQQFGNINQDGVAYPAADPNVFAVGAVDSSDVITTWAQRGDELDLLAPGENIILPKLGGGTESVDGTSFSSPMVAGAAALIKQITPSAKAGDIGSILMSSGVNNRDGDQESGNTTGLEFGRLDIESALKLAKQRAPKRSSATLGKVFDTALDSQGVLHVAYYDAKNSRLMYCTRTTSGRWSTPVAIDAAGDVGSQLSIAVDTTGKVAIAYYDVTNTNLKYASFNGTNWSVTTVDADGDVGTTPSVSFDIDGNAYVAYYKRTSGDLKLAVLNRDQNTWSTRTIDGVDGANVGADASIDVGEAAIRSGFFTQYDTTVAIAYSDTTNGNLKYARLDVDDTTATWFIAVVDDVRGVDSIDLDLHAGPLNSGLQAQIAYRNKTTGAIRYAYRNTDWFKETVATGKKIGDGVQLYFDASDRPIVAFTKASGAFATSTRIVANDWNVKSSAGIATVIDAALNVRTDDTVLSWVNKASVVKVRGV